MDLYFSDPGDAKISMIKYLKKVFEDFPELIKITWDPPAAERLFKVRTDDKKKLPEEQAWAFHHAVAQLLFLSMRARPDIKIPISLLIKRVCAPDEDNWGKLKCVLQALKGTMYLKLTLR